MRVTNARVDHPELISPPKVEKSLGEGKRRVHFNNQVRVRKITNLACIDEATKSNLYYSLGDHSTFKDKARSVTENVQSKDEKDKTSNSYSRVLFRIFTECCKSSDLRIEEEDKLALEHWVALGHCRRGLERWCIPSMDSERRARRSVSIRAVVEMQSLLLDGVKMCDRPDLMARVYETLTGPAKRYAKILGEADAAAVRKKETDFTMAERYVHREPIICDDQEKRQYVKSCTRMAIRSPPGSGLRRAQSCRRLVTQSSFRGISRSDSMRLRNVA